MRSHLKLLEKASTSEEDKAGFIKASTSEEDKAGFNTVMGDVDGREEYRCECCGMASQSTRKVKFIHVTDCDFEDLLELAKPKAIQEHNSKSQSFSIGCP